MKRLHVPLNPREIAHLRTDQYVLLSGTIYTARDQAHKRLVEMLKKGQKLPIDLKSATIFYCGPTPAHPGDVIGSCGPTTASRMDGFTPLLMQHGLRLMIGKGSRNDEVATSIKRHKGAYLAAFGGCGAYIYTKVKKKQVVAFADLGPEALYRLEVEDFPAIVAVDSTGNSIF